MGLKKVPHSWSVMRAPKVSAECVSLLHFWVVGAKRAIMCETKWQQTSTCLGQQVVLGFFKYHSSLECLSVMHDITKGSSLDTNFFAQNKLAGAENSPPLNYHKAWLLWPVCDSLQHSAWLGLGLRCCCPTWEVEASVYGERTDPILLFHVCLFVFCFHS